MKLSSFAITDPGLKRSLNEDSYFASDELGLYLVADGMGGHRAGDVASRAAVNDIAKQVKSLLGAKGQSSLSDSDTVEFDEDSILGDVVREANERLCRLSRESDVFRGMGTTLVGLLYTGSVAHIVNVGDSRAYRIRDGEIMQLTIDHSWVGEQLQRNLLTEEEARQHKWRNIITRALGNRRDVEIDTAKSDVKPGDYFLLCTDGLSGMLTNEEILEITQERGDDLEGACKTLVERSNERGGLDNMTAVLIRFSD